MHVVVVLLQAMLSAQQATGCAEVSAPPLQVTLPVELLVMVSFEQQWCPSSNGYGYVARGQVD